MVPGSISTDATRALPGGPAAAGGEADRRRDGRSRSVIEIMKANSRLPDFLHGDMWAGIAAARVGERRILELARRYGVETFLAALEQLHGPRRAGRARARSASCPRGAFRARGGAGQRRRLPRHGRDHQATSSSSTCATTRTRIRGPNNVSRDGAVIAAQMAAHEPDRRRTRRRTRGTSGRCACSPGPARSSTRCAPAAFAHLLRGADPALRPDPALPRAAPRRPAARRRLRARSAARSSAGRIPTPAGTSRSSSRRSAAGARLADARRELSAHVQRVHGDTFNCPAEVAEARYGLYVDRLALTTGPGGEGEHRGGKGIVLEYRVRANGCFLTCAYTRSTPPAVGAGRRPRRLAQPASRWSAATARVERTPS